MYDDQPLTCDSAQGGDEIDDVFGCVAKTRNNMVTVTAIDTFNAAGGGRQNLGDGETVILSVCNCVSMCYATYVSLSQ